MFWNRKRIEPIKHIRQLMDDNFDEILDLDAARKDTNGYVVLHGDDGGQIYLTVPARKVRCSEADLKGLLLKIDAQCWDDERTALVYFERGNPGQEVAGGMNGGLLTDGLWLHPELENMRELIAKELKLT